MKQRKVIGNYIFICITVKDMRYYGDTSSGHFLCCYCKQMLPTVTVIVGSITAIMIAVEVVFK